MLVNYFGDLWGKQSFPTCLSIFRGKVPKSSHSSRLNTQTFAGIGGSSPSLSCSCQAWEMMASRVAAVPLAEAAEAAVVEAEDDEPRSAIGTPESVKQCLVRIDRKALPRTGQRS